MDTKPTATIYRMVMDQHVCPWGLRAKHLLESRGFAVGDRWRTPREAPAALKALPRAQGAAQPGLSSRLRSITSAAEQEAERLKDEYTSTEHLFVALASEGGRSASAKFPSSRQFRKTPSCRPSPRSEARSV